MLEHVAAQVHRRCVSLLARLPSYASTRPLGDGRRAVLCAGLLVTGETRLARLAERYRLLGLGRSDIESALGRVLAASPGRLLWLLSRGDDYQRWLLRKGNLCRRPWLWLFGRAAELASTLGMLLRLFGLDSCLHIGINSGGHLPSGRVWVECRRQDILGRHRSLTFLLSRALVAVVLSLLLRVRSSQPSRYGARGLRLRVVDRGCRLLRLR